MKEIKDAKYELKKALLQLMKKKKLEEINVKELCNAAGINRSSFYAHYQTINDIFNEIKQSILLQLNEYLKLVASSSSYQSIEELINGILLKIKEDKQFSDIITISKIDTTFRNEIFYNILMSAHLLNEHDNIEQTYKDIFLVNGSIGIIYYWMDNDFKEDVNVLTNIIIQMASTTLKIKK